MFLLILATCIGATFAQGAANLGPCGACAFEKDCIILHPSDCQKYAVCTWDYSQNVHHAVVRSCPFGTFFHHRTGACDHPENVKCTNDPCKGLKDGTQYKSQYGCRGYWMCKNEVSDDHCCKPFHSFSIQTGTCVPDETCGLVNDFDCARYPDCAGPIQHEANCRMYYNCTAAGGYKKKCCPYGEAFNKERKRCEASGSCNNECEDPTGSCYLKEVPQNLRQYQIGNYTKDCAPGTMFSSENCTCINDKDSKTGCVSVVDFSLHEDQHYIGSPLVIDSIRKKAIFGNDSTMNTYLKVSFFDEAKPADQLMIKTVFQPKHINQKQMVFVSSCDPSVPVSPIKITLDPNTNTLFATARTEDEMQVVQAQYMPGRLNELTFTFTMSEVSVSIKDELGQLQGNTDTKKFAAKDPLRKWNTPMCIGGYDGNFPSETEGPFVGEMDSIDIYHDCIPEGQATV